MAKIENATLWQSHRSGMWICELYDHEGCKAVGLGRTKLEAQARAHRIAGWNIKAMLPLMNAIEGQLQIPNLVRP